MGYFLGGNKIPPILLTKYYIGAIVNYISNEPIHKGYRRE